MKEIGRTHVPSNLYARQCHSLETLPFVADEVPVKAGMEGEPWQPGEKLPLRTKAPPPPPHLPPSIPGLELLTVSQVNHQLQGGERTGRWAHHGAQAVTGQSWKKV